jgi:hypothetical protein
MAGGVVPGLPWGDAASHVGLNPARSICRGPRRVGRPPMWPTSWGSVANRLQVQIT